MDLLMIQLSEDVKIFIDEINVICNNEIDVNISSINYKDNYFLNKIVYSNYFKQLTLEKIKRLYEKYKIDFYSKKVIISDIKNLFRNNWDGAYKTLYEMQFKKQEVS